MTLVNVTRLSKRFGARWALNDVSFRIEQREVSCVIGPSGCGKTTLLRCISGLEVPDSGEVEVLGVNVREAAAESNLLGMKQTALDKLRSKVGIVLQSLYLWPHKTIEDNITLGPRRVLGISDQHSHQLCSELLDYVGLSDRAQDFPHQLSSGEQQRVAIARALAMKPKVLLLDEITSALDPERVWQICNLIRRLTSEGLTMLIVTHEMAFAREIADTVIFLDKGRLIERGATAQFFHQPSELRAREFLSRALAIRGRGVGSE